MKKLLRYDEWGVPLALVLGIILLFINGPSGNDFYWSDAPRHALNGVFLKDLIADAPLNGLTEYAYRYYAQYPALTILFYPPLLYVISAPFYALLGVSGTTALLVIAFHYIAFALGSWRLFRFWLSAWQAGAAALMLVASPEIAFWGRQVMLEVPAFSFLIWSAVYFTCYRREAKPKALYIAGFLLILAMYTKLSTCFVAVAFVATLLVERRTAILQNRHAWILLILSTIGLIPLLLITLKFGQANLQSVTGVADAVASRKTLVGWVWYTKQLPDQLGWPLLLTAVVALATAALRRTLGGLSRHDVLFWLLWYGSGYLFFSAIDLKEARHSVFILVPVVLAAALLLSRISSVRLSAVALGLLTAAVVAQTVWFRPVHYIKGYDKAADFIARQAPKDSAVLFSGYRDGSFVFNMRAREDRRDLTVIRADKLFLSVAVRRELGVAQKNLSENDIRTSINQLGIHYLVVQPGFWNDLAIMQRFERVLASDQFQEVARIPTPANHNAHEKELVIYKNLGPVSSDRAQMRLDLPIIGRSIQPSTP